MSDVEIWDLYDKDRKRVGKTHIRGERIPDGLYHLVIHAWIKNSKGEYLISQRSADRPTFPLMWECVGGSALVGEESLDAALREIREEVGLDLQCDDGKIVYSLLRDVLDGKRYGDIMDAWLFEYDGEVDLMKATTREVAATEWMTYGEIEALNREGKLVPSLEYFFSENFKKKK